MLDVYVTNLASLLKYGYDINKVNFPDFTSVSKAFRENLKPVVVDTGLSDSADSIIVELILDTLYADYKIICASRGIQSETYTKTANAAAEVISIFGEKVGENITFIDGLFIADFARYSIISDPNNGRSAPVKTEVPVKKTTNHEDTTTPTNALLH